MSDLDRNTFGAYDAKTHFSELLQRVANGEEVTITRHGAPVARMVPITAAASVEERKAAILAMRSLSKRNRLNGVRTKDLKSEGRR